MFKHLSKIQRLTLALLIFGGGLIYASSAAARVCFLPDSTDCGEGDVDVPEVQITCATYGGYETEAACLEARTNKTAQACTLNSGCYYPKCAYDSERTCKNENPDKNCLNTEVDGVKCWYAQAKTCSDLGYKTSCGSDETATKVDVEASDAPCYTCTKKKTCKMMNYYGSKDNCPNPTSNYERKETNYTDKDGDKCYTCEPKACTKLNASYKNKYNKDTCGSGKTSQKVDGTDSAADGPCYTCVNDDSPSCYDTVVVIECLRYGGSGCNTLCGDEKCSKAREGIEFFDGLKYVNKDIVGEDGYAGQYVCRMVAEGANSSFILRFYYKNNNNLHDGDYHPCEQGEACIVYSDVDYSQTFQLEYSYSGNIKRVDLMDYQNSNDFSIVVNMLDTEDEGLIIEDEKLLGTGCITNSFYKRDMPEINVCNDDKTTITIKTKDVIEDCTDDSWDDWKDDYNGTSFTCDQKVTSSFKTQASDGNSYNVSLSLNGRNLITDGDDNEITENVSSCHVLNYPLNITANSETNIYTYGTCQIYTDDDSYYYYVEAGANTLSVNINGIQVLSNLTSNREDTEFAILGDFNGKTYDAGNYTIKFVKTTDYCKDINTSYIGENSNCLSTQNKIPVDGVTTEIDGQCYTCQTKSEYANTATLCCSLGYQEREYMSGFNWYSYTGDGVKEGCVPYLMWQDAVNQHKNDDDYVSEYGSKPNGYPNQFGCPAYGMDGKWYIGWFGSMQLDFGLNYCPDVDVNPYSGGDKAFEFGNYIEGSLYNISGYVQDGIYKQRLITSLLDTKENHGVVCGDNIQKWLDEHRSNVTMCRYNFTTVTRDDDAYYKIHEIGSSSNEMLNHCWYQDAEGRDVTDNIVASKRAPAARNKIAPIDESKADDDYQVRTYAEKYNGDLVDACKGYSTNKEKLTPLTVDIKNQNGYLVD